MANVCLQMAPGSTEGNGSLTEGTRVEVRQRLDSRWARGFEVAGLASDGYVIRRRSDGELLPVSFGADDVRPERRHDSWWY